MHEISYYQDYTGFTSHPDIQIYTPNTVTELQKILLDRYQKNTPITIAGGLTGLTGSFVSPTNNAVIGLENILTLSDSLLHSLSQRENGRWLIREKYQLREVTNTNQKSGHFLLAHDRQSAIFPAGIKLSDIDIWLAELNLWYTPRPGEVRAQIGGNVATNASGPRTFSFGPTRDSVLGVEFIFPTGEIAWIERGQYTANGRNFDWEITVSEALEDTSIPSRTSGIETKHLSGQLPSYIMPNTKHAAGLYVTDHIDLIDLIIGSEGILGTITAVKVKLEPAREIDSRIIFFNDYDHCIGFVDSVRTLKLEPKNYRQTPDAQNLGILSIEFFDHNALEISDYNHPSFSPNTNNSSSSAENLSVNAKKNLCAVEIEFFAHDAVTENKLITSAKKFHSTGFITDQTVRRTIRYSVPKNTNQLLKNNEQKKLSTDHAVPAEHFRELFAAYQQAQQDFAGFCEKSPCVPLTKGELKGDLQKNKGKHIHSALWGHLSSYHLHLNFISRTAQEFEYGQKLYLELAELVVKLGGTISAEHGVGKKTIEKNGASIPYLQLMYSESDLNQIRDLKKIFDPKMLVCRGNMIF